jgi:hypothetical protein
MSLEENNKTSKTIVQPKENQVIDPGKISVLFLETSKTGDFFLKMTIIELR